MFDNKNERIHKLEMENSGLEFDKSMLLLERDSATDDLELCKRNIDSLSYKLVLAERAANTVIDANQEFVRLHAKDWLEIRELKADIAEQVRVNRAYAEEIGSLCERLARHHEQDMKHVVEGIFGPKETSPEPDPVPTEETNRGYGPEYLKLQRQAKRLRAKVKKLTSDNKAMAAEVLHNRNSM